MARSASTGDDARQRRRARAVPVAGTALLLIDVINDLAFDGSEALVAQAESMAAPPRALKRRATAAGVPAIYINDNFGQWRSDFRQHGRALHRALLAGPARVAASAADRARLLRVEAETLGLLRHHPGHLARDAAHPSGDSHGHRGQHLRALHRQRRVHARIQDLRTRGLHRLEHGR